MWLALCCSSEISIAELSIRATSSPRETSGFTPKRNASSSQSNHACRPAPSSSPEAARSKMASKQRGMRWLTSTAEAAMLGCPPLLRQDERLTLLRCPDERREDVLAGPPAVPPVWATAATLTRQRHSVDTTRLRARRHAEDPSWHRPDLGPLVAPDRETSTHATGYTHFDHRDTSCGPGPGVLLHRRGVSSLRPTPWRSAPWGRMSAGKEGAQGL